MGKVVPLTAAYLLLCIKRIHSNAFVLTHAIPAFADNPSTQQCCMPYWNHLQRNARFCFSFSRFTFNWARNFSCVMRVFLSFFMEYFWIWMLNELQIHYTWMHEMLRIRPVALIEGSSASICGKEYNFTQIFADNCFPFHLITIFTFFLLDWFVCEMRFSYE